MRILFLLFAAAGPLWPQPVVSARAGLVYHVEGAVAANGEMMDPASLRFVQLEPGQMLETWRGFAEASLGPGRTLRVAPRSQIELLSDDINGAGIFIRRGAVIVDWKDPNKGATVSIRTGETSVILASVGLYRVDAEPDASRLRVYEGRAMVGDGLKLEKGRETALETAAPPPVRFDPRRLDFFDRWNARRARAASRIARAGSGRSVRRGPPGAGRDVTGDSRGETDPFWRPGPFF